MKPMAVVEVIVTRRVNLKPMLIAMRCLGVKPMAITRQVGYETDNDSNVMPPGECQCKANNDGGVMLLGDESGTLRRCFIRPMSSMSWASRS